MSLHNILVRDFTTEQKKLVETAADSQNQSTSRFIRDSAVTVATTKAKKKPAAKGKPAPKQKTSR